MKTRFFTLLIATLFVFGIKAQVTDIGKFLAAGPEDAEKLMEGYLSPYFNAFGASLTGGWYNTAKPHQLGGFDITATFNTAMVPDNHKMFNVAELGLESLGLADPNNNMSPTIAGDKNEGPLLNYNFPEPLPDQPAFNLPQGTGFAYIPSPMLQAGVGLIKDTEVNFRFMPTYSYKESNVGMWGLGFKHGLKQWLPFIKRVPVLHLTVQYGYTKLNSNVGIDVNPSHIGAQDQSGLSWEDQKMEFITQSHTGNLLVSANLPVVCFYGGVGFASTQSNLAMKGIYPVADPVASLTAGVPVVTAESAMENPIDMEVKNSDGSTTKPRYNVGMRLKFAVITLHGDYTYANYSMFTFGFGISFR